MDYVGAVLDLAQTALLGYLAYKSRTPDPREVIKRVLVDRIGQGGGRERLRALIAKRTAERLAKKQ